MKKAGYCTEPTNSEIFDYYVKPLERESWRLEITSHDSDGNKLTINSKESIVFISLDGEITNFYINFWGARISIFISDLSPRPERKFTFNEEFMFIDDAARAESSSSEVDGNVVYEGNLRDKTHKEILDLLREVTVLLIGATAIRIDETVVIPVGGSPRNRNYDICDYVVRITNDTGEKNEAVFDNIKFIINSD